MTHSRRQRSGFTLVETALALLAISLGLLGIFGLARHGLKASGDAEQEIRCAILADTVFATLHAKNDELIASKTALNTWYDFWAYLFKSGTAYIYLPPMPELSETGEALRLYYGRNPPELLPSTATTEIKWSPIYTLGYEFFDQEQLVVTLSIHPGILQSGAETRTYTTTLNYTGGLP